ncbi:MAG: presenilin family intramembrane aspartyl protease [Candidatus Woesearchaeota archaeon]
MKHTWIVTCSLLVLFFCAQLVGLQITASYIDRAASEEKGEIVWKDLPAVAGMKIKRPDVEPQFSIWYIVGAVLIGTLLILLIIKLGKVLLWKLWFFFAVVLCLQIALAVFIPALYSFILALVLGFFKIFRPNIYIHNATELLLYGGLAAIFVPILNVFYSFILLLALSIYDMYAVWRSRHMIKMAKFQTKSGIFAGLLLPYRVPKARGVKKQVRTAVLGGGDIGFPLIFAGTVLVASGFLNAFVVSLGATAALFILLLLSQRDKFYPAMPFLTAGCAFGYVITLLLL